MLMVVPALQGMFMGKGRNTAAVNVADEDDDL
jgi:hypothetical protein